MEILAILVILLVVVLVAFTVEVAVIGLEEEAKLQEQHQKAIDRLHGLR